MIASSPFSVAVIVAVPDCPEPLTSPDEILDTYLEAIRNGDWRAAEALYDRVYGKSTQRHEVEASSGPIPQAELDTWSDEKIAERLKKLEAMPE